MDDLEVFEPTWQSETQYKALFEHAINTMVACGGYIKEWADKNFREAVYKGIKEMD